MVNNSLGETKEDDLVLKEVKRSTKKFQKLCKDNDIQAEVLLFDWKDVTSLLLESSRFLRTHPTWSPCYWPQDMGDDHILVFTSKPVDERVVAELGRLYYEEGAVIEEIHPDESQVLTEEKFFELMKEELAGTGNEFDEEEDLDSLKEISNLVYKNLKLYLKEEKPDETVKPSPYQIVWGDLSGNEPNLSTYPSKEAMIDSLEKGDWNGGVILAIFDPKGNGLLEELDKHIHDENH